ncbi:hypothetical protein OGAPHI_004436 [Ogataea philodendri]|uniref:Uncharacterized protein n=1 Tax=Ogataea philodendri TaxID=1378263 RepID=A0A9P8P6K9_9ASCO|nr:uncharacterized protein OGAPHI_004436 [Ogataea philodendri]KAH3666247.1 hypothetical protein OGAPHI_004436 [Ogataea philodendri]
MLSFSRWASILVTTPLTLSRVPIKLNLRSSFSSFQTLISPFHDPDSIKSLYGIAQMAVIQYGCGFGTCSLASSGFVSALARQTSFSGSNPCACLWMNVGFFLAKDHKQMLPLSEPVTKWESSIIETQSMLPSASVSGSNSDTSFLGQSSNIHNQILMSIQGFQLCQLIHAVRSNFQIGTGCVQLVAISTESKTQNFASTISDLHHSHRSKVLAAPYYYTLVSCSRHNISTIRTNGDGQNLAAMAIVHLFLGNLCVFAPSFGKLHFLWFLCLVTNVPFHQFHVFGDGVCIWVPHSYSGQPLAGDPTNGDLHIV